jgi:hypothetical protein
VGESWTRSSALTDANRNILLHVQDADAGELEWEFFCECGRNHCHEHVFLTLDAFIAIHDGGDAVLAEGHRLSQSDLARRLRDDAGALRAQAEHQIRRAKKNLG